MSSESAEAILQRVNEAGEGFISFEVVPAARDDAPSTGYLRASDVVAVAPVHPRHYEAHLDEPPEWYEQYAPD